MLIVDVQRHEIIIVIIKRKLKAQINPKKTSQVRRDGAGTENYSIQCNVNETEMWQTDRETGRQMRLN